MLLARKLHIPMVMELTYESAVNFAFKEMLRLLAGKFGLGPIRATPEPGQVNAEHLKIKAVHLLSDIERNWYPGAAQTARDHFGWHFMITQGVEQTVEAIEFADIRRQARQMQGIPHSPYR